jgi:hypothetical protein
MVVGVVREGTRTESPGELHIGSCQVIWQTELVSAQPAAGAFGAASPSGGESKRLVNTPVAGASDCSVAVEMERGRAANPWRQTEILPVRSS